MGSSSLLDIIGSFIIGGLLLIMAWRLNAGTAESSFAHYSSAILQGNVTALAANIETDFRKIAYCRNYMKINPPQLAIRIADSSRFRFWTDIDNNGSLDSITYWTSSTTIAGVAETPNPNDRILYRQVNNHAPSEMFLGITKFTFSYRDLNEDVIPFGAGGSITGNTLLLVRSVELTVALESPAQMRSEGTADTSSYQTYWKQIRLASRNYNNR
jgi:hypothetical protein